MRKEHFESIFSLLDIKNFSDEIIFQKFVENSIQDQTDKVMDICKTALDQMTLRQQVQIYVDK